MQGWSNGDVRVGETASLGVSSEHFAIEGSAILELGDIFQQRHVHEEPKNFSLKMIDDEDLLKSDEMA